MNLTFQKRLTPYDNLDDLHLNFKIMQKFNFYQNTDEKTFLPKYEHFKKYL